MMTIEATPTEFRHNGRVYTLHTYVDPHPGMKASERIHYRDTCSRCGGSGIFRWPTARGEAAGTCFGCYGEGTVVRSNAVSTLRRNAKTEALWREYGDELRAERQASEIAAEAARKAAEFAKAWDEAHAEQQRRATLNNGTVGEVGERVRDIEATVEVAAAIERDSYSGVGTETVMLVVFRLDDGRVMKVFGTTQALYSLERGERVTVTGTVKGFGEYKGQTQTILSRVKVVRAD